MDTKSIKSLIKLFSISINLNNRYYKADVSGLFEKFLKNTIEHKYIAYFLDLFESDIGFYSSLESAKKVSLNSVRILSLCDETAIELSTHSRFEVLFHLICLIYDAGNIDRSLEFLKLVSSCYGFNINNFNSLYGFITGDNEKGNVIRDGNDIIAGYLKLHNDIIIFKPAVKDLFEINNEPLDAVRTYFLSINSLVVYRKSKKYFFHDFINHSNSLLYHDKYELVIRDIEVFRKDKILIHKLSLSFSSCGLIGILGKSGSGKTTLLKTIAGLERYYNGKVFLKKGACVFNDFKRAFVSQSNAFIPLFTVKEHLVQRMNFLQINKFLQDKLVEEVLNHLDLKDETGKIVINTDNSGYQLSGGQQKRLAIAMELITDPDILLLDEPTSGLSSDDSSKIISLLKQISLENKIVVASIHQPDYETFMMFDKILIIDESGYPVYYDSPSYAVEYFRELGGKIDRRSLIETYFNPSVLFQLIGEKEHSEDGKVKNQRKRSPAFLYNKFLDLTNRSIYHNENDLVVNNPVKNRDQNFYKSILDQLILSLKIELKNKSRFFLLSTVPLVVGVLFSIILKYSGPNEYIYYYNPNIPVWIIIVLISSIFIGLVNSGHEYIYLRQFHENENLVIDKTVPLLISKVIKYFIISFLQSVIIILPAVLILKAEFHFYAFLIVTWLLNLWACISGLLLSLFFRNVTTVYLIIPLIIIPQMIFSGALVEFGNFNKILQKDYDIPLIADFIPVRWASEAIITELYLNNDYERKYYNQKQLFFESIYYLDFVIPQVKSICNEDSLKAKEILYNEFGSEFNINNLNPGGIDTLISFIENEFLKQKNSAIRSVDNINRNIINIESQMQRYSNMYVNNIVANRNRNMPFIIKDLKFHRKYMPAYIISKSFSNNNVFLTGIKKINNSYLSTFNYNVLMLVNFIFITFILLFVSATIKNHKPKNNIPVRKRK